MIHYGSKSPKRHVAFSNNKVIGKLWAGPLTKTDRVRAAGKNFGFRPVKSYVNKHGKKKYCGTADLKKTQNLEFGSSFI
jgi:hypothetical protein